MLRRALESWLPYLAAFAAAGYTFFSTSAVIDNFKQEIRDRRSATCQSFESSHLQEVRQLSNTYAYLESLTPAERKTSINKFVYRISLPQLEAEARSDQDNIGIFVPGYCDLPGYGLPEPDPKVPTRPKGL
jgi:hypothetical protein